jgi:hypothetical protein
VSQNILNHPAPVILAIKSKTYHGRYEKYTIIQKSYILNAILNS